MKQCAKCSEPIVGKRSNAIYCSKKCSQAVRGQKYAQKYPERAVQHSLKWRRAHPDWVRAYDKSFTEKRRELVFNHYGRTCVCCGEDELGFLTIDHINNDGAEHRRNGATSIYRWLVTHDFPEGFQVLCWNCNAAKQFRDGCPHQRKSLPQ